MERWKKVIISLLLILVMTFSGIVLNTFVFNPEYVKADEIIGKGEVNADVTGLRIRTSTSTSDSSNIITVVNGGFGFDIYDKVYTSDTYYWYKIGFDYDGSYTYGYISGEFVHEVIVYEDDTDFEEYLEKQQFPESYKEGLRNLHARYPKWVFVADHIGKDWNEVVENENAIGRSLIHESSISSWKSIEEGCYDWDSDRWIVFDSGGWVQASSELVQYALDARNFLNETNIFMFERLSYNSNLHTQSGISNVIRGTFMSDSGHDLSYNGTRYTYASGLLKAGQESGVSPYHLASRIIQEQGSSGYGGSISGTISGYEGYYNYYNQGAFAANGQGAVVNGLIYAKRYDEETLRPWNSRMLSIIGGAKIIGKNYINRGQDTIYYEKFDMVSPYWHQYMTNILAARSESVSASRAYSDEIKENTALVFTIPVYENMPESACLIPEGDGSPNNLLKNLEIEGYTLTPSFSKYTTEYTLVVENDVDTIQIWADALGDVDSIEGLGQKDLAVGDNVFDIDVNAGNGTTRTYTITVARKEKDNPPSPSKPISFTSDYTFDKDAHTVSGIALGSTIQDVVEAVHIEGDAVLKVYDKNDIEKTSGIIGTGDVLKIVSDDGIFDQFTAILYGDVNGDGEIDLLDMAELKSSMLGWIDLSDIYLKAADVNRKDGVDLIDMAVIKWHILGMEAIVQ